MSARDRIVLIVVGLVVALGAFWMLVLTPKRKEASDLSAKISAAQQRLDAAQSSAAAAESAKRQYDVDYATVARLGKAVPVEDDVPSLVYQLEATAHDNHVDFRKISLNGSGGGAPAPAPAAAVATAGGTSSSGSSGSSGSAAAASATAAALPPGASVGSAGFPTMPFAFDFQGSFFNLQRFLHAVDELTSVQGKTIKVKGRLLTVDGFDLKAGPKGFPSIDATIAATAYLLPADEGLTAGATPTGPAAPGAAGSTSVASSSSSPAPGTTASLIGSK